MSDPTPESVRLCCKECGVDIGEARKGKPGRQQVFCKECKLKKKKANEKKHHDAWNAFSKGQFCRRKKRS